MSQALPFKPERSVVFERADWQLDERIKPRDRTCKTADFCCDTCERNVPIEQRVTSVVLPYSEFCSADCREEAELAAEDARIL